MILKSKPLSIRNAAAGFSKSETIINNVTGQEIKFINIGAGDDILEMESTFPSFSEEPPMHFHPIQEEYFEVIDGELTVRFKEGLRQYQAGSLIHIKAKQAHAMWNSGFIPTKVNWKVKPALETAEFLKTLWQLANDGKTNEAGRPQMILLTYLLAKFKNTFRLVKPNLTIVALLSVLFFPVFYFKKYSKKY